MSSDLKGVLQFLKPAFSFYCFFGGLFELLVIDSRNMEQRLGD